MALPKFILAQQIWQDIRRYSFTYVLAIAVLLSAFSVIYMSHLNRQATIQLERLYSERDELDVEWRNLRLEQHSLAEHSDIEIKAKQHLNMYRPKASEEIIINVP
ncbi:cell division protein FtsL [Thalassotalea maritima]|uniref:cell division protein FtsL n=1 Tax=Thalassotalea maritima TaxID=3242416 RepID=UPI003527CA2E